MSPRRESGTRHRRISAVLLAAATLALFASPAAAKTRFVTFDAFDAPGPATYDKVTVLEQGPPDADHVLVLEPGAGAGSAYFRPLAKDLVNRLPDWQVWSVEQRENLLEDQSWLNAAKAGKITVQQLFDYYLNWFGNSNPAPQHFAPVPDADVPFARQWGLNVAVEDLRRVIDAARKGGRTVVLGGHSFGGAVTTAYATWDFHGHAGAEQLSGLVFIDGASGASGGGEVPTKAEAEQELRGLENGSPWLDLIGNGAPWSTGVFSAFGSTAALKEPDAPSPGHNWPYLPPSLRAPVQDSNRGGFGYAFDTETSPESLAFIHCHIGHFAESGDPRGWVNGELGTVERAATMASGLGLRGHDGSEWYFPRRLFIDADAIDNGNRNPAQAVLGERAFHGDDATLPIYAFETSFGQDNGVLDAVRRLAGQSHVPAGQRTLVARHGYAHLDPLVALPRKNAFLKTVVRFLGGIG